MYDEATFQSLTALLTDASMVVIGLGNPDRGDDGVGIEMAKQLNALFHGRFFFETERSAESVVFELLESGHEGGVLFIDAVDFGGEPGAMKLFGIAEARRFVPALSTHKVPITLFMDILQGKGMQFHLFGIQPGSTTLFSEMTDSVKRALDEFKKNIVDKIKFNGI